MSKKDMWIDSLNQRIAALEAQISLAKSSGSIEPLKDQSTFILQREIKRAVDEALELDGNTVVTTAKEWGVRWGGQDDVQVYGCEAAARGIFKHYGEPHEELVFRLTTAWYPAKDTKKGT